MPQNEILLGFGLSVKNNGNDDYCRVSKTILPSGSTVIIQYDSKDEKRLAMRSFAQANAISNIKQFEYTDTKIDLENMAGNTEYVDQKAQLLQTQIDQVQDLAQTNELKISIKADQLDLETTQIQVEENRLSILTKADIQALAMLAQLVDTKADQSYVNQQIALLVGSAPEALNTVYELAAAIQNEASLIDALNQSVANRVRFDIANQALTEIQKQNARINIDAEKIGTAQQLVSQITAQNLGAATAAQGAKADTALQSFDVAPVAFSGLFTSLASQNKIFDVVFSAYVLGSSTAISASDTLGQIIGKLQAQINGVSPPVWVKANTIGTVHPNVDLSNLEFARVDGTLRMRGWITVLTNTVSNTAIFTITNVNYKIKRPLTTAGSTVESGVLNYIADSATIVGLRLRVTNTCVDATTAATSTQAIYTNSTMAITTHPYMPYGVDYVGQLAI